MLWFPTLNLWCCAASARFLRHKRRQSVRSGRKRGHMDDKADNTIDDARAAGKLLLVNYSEFHEELGKDLEEEEADLSASVDALRRRIAKADAKEPMQNASSRGPTQRESAPVVGDLQAIRYVRRCHTHMNMRYMRDVCCAQCAFVGSQHRFTDAPQRKGSWRACGSLLRQDESGGVQGCGR